MRGNGKIIYFLLKKIAKFDISEDEKKFILNLRDSFFNLSGEEKGGTMRRLREIWAGFHPEIGEKEGIEYKYMHRLIKELEK